MLNSILLGSFLTAITITIHAAGTTYWVVQLRKAQVQQDLNSQNALSILKVLCLTALLLLSLHISEVIVWAIAYLLLPDLEHISTLEAAVYFSMVTFGSLGYGDIVIDNRWRMLSGIECMTGILICGWSTALLLSVVQQLWKTPQKTT